MRILLSILLVLLVVPGYSEEPLRPMIGEARAIITTPVPLDEDDPSRTKLGSLTYLGGVELRAADGAFGGFSAIDVDGDRFTLLSDLGYIVRFRLMPDWKAVDPVFADLPGGPGAGWLKQDRDSESLVRDPATGTYLVGFENSNAIWRYSGDFRRALGHVRPSAMKGWPENLGPESISRMPDGGYAVFSEGGQWPGRRTRAALRFSGDPIRQPHAGFRFGYRMPGRGRPADATLLPDGRMLVLTRNFSLHAGFTARLSIVDPGAIRPGATVGGTVIARFASPVLHDNFEGVAATHEGKDTILWIVSDDNLSVLQRTLLLKFRLDPAAGAAGSTQN